jgi:hypothetical protein
VVTGAVPPVRGSRFLHRPPATARESAEQIEVAGDQGQLLGARPALDLALAGDRVGDHTEILRPEQANRPAQRGVAAVEAALVLADALLERAARDPRVEGAIGAFQDVDPCHHRRVMGGPGTLLRAVPPMRGSTGSP